MIVLRLISLLLLAVALMTLGADGITSLESENDEFVVRSLDQILALVDASPKTWFEANLPAAVSGALNTALSWPAWAITGVIGIVLSLISGRSE